MPDKARYGNYEMSAREAFRPRSASGLTKNACTDGQNQAQKRMRIIGGYLSPQEMIAAFLPTSAVRLSICRCKPAHPEQIRAQDEHKFQRDGLRRTGQISRIRSVHPHRATMCAV